MRLLENRLRGRERERERQGRRKTYTMLLLLYSCEVLVFFNMMAIVATNAIVDSGGTENSTDSETSSITTGQCMTSSGVSNSFVIDGICYWTVKASAFTTWDSAKRACSEKEGIMAIIGSDNLNDELAARIKK